MPFRCKCGQTFEKTDTFASHTSACARFHRRDSDTSSLSSSPPQMISFSASPPNRFTNYMQAHHQQPPQQQNSTVQQQQGSDLFPRYVPGFLPTALSIHSTFEGVRRRSMSAGSTEE
ncbi:hypothetical protein K450DRAFT_195312 [Umbelopsis ramanniana AG]|uniref:Uncharacterized protein n=1 Tax=Umbelopsis ramanniana AG TaxID=1314678 RepID=A0AAD5EIB2_UMBRA|nr:uncharacterized protein K450DRAFT_195312 [Umbelopsis ramanniana AG]KAI8584213.1 hypothetical protein K450DRAFT_195312 [Umbelopsis ramanniana AG]